MYKFKNEEDYYKFVVRFRGRSFCSDYLEISIRGTIIIPKGYAWDGCTPKFTFLDLVFGTPDGAIGKHGKPKTYYASMVHDALYQYKSEVPISRKEADKLFYEMLKEEDFYWSKVYYFAVRAFGWMFGKWKVR